MIQQRLSYSKQYPRNSRSLTTFSYLANTVIPRRELLPFHFASFLYIRLILNASRRLTWTVSPYSPDPARLQPLGKLLGPGHVALYVARRLLPPLHSFNTSPSVEMPFRNLPGDLVPGSGYEAAQLTYWSESRPHEQEQMKVPRSSPLDTKPPEASELTKPPLQALT